MKKIICVIGTRPEAIKMAPIIIRLRSSCKLIPVVISTGQHQDLLIRTLKDLEITPDYKLEVMTENQTPGNVIASIMSSFPNLISSLNISAVLVQGDTATAYATALSSFMLNLPVGHVEAGLRTYNLQEPWPEEALRQMIDRISTWHFAPTSISKRNLIRENINPNNIHVTGNTVIDQILSIQQLLPNPNNVLSELGIKPGKYILMTGHRRENHGNNFNLIAQAIKTIADINPKITIIYPVHPNPNVRIPMESAFGKNKNIKLISPLGYFDFLSLMKECEFLISDSGGVQEEASIAGKKVLLLRNNTERPEGITAGMTIVVGSNINKIISSANRLLKDGGRWDGDSPFGDGHAGEKIVDILEKDL